MIPRNERGSKKNIKLKLELPFIYISSVNCCFIVRSFSSLQKNTEILIRNSFKEIKYKYKMSYKYKLASEKQVFKIVFSFLSCC